MFEKSKEIYDEASKYLPGGVSSSIRFLKTLGHPLYVSRGRGSKLYDVDGNEYVDLCMAHGATMLGHSNPRVTQAIRETLKDGVCSAETEATGRLAKKLSEMVPCAEMIRFVNSGTEATMHCIRLARGYTGKSKIIKFEGHFHGFHDYVLLSFTPPLEKIGPEDAPIPYVESAGIPQETTVNTIVLPFNNIEVFEGAIKRHRNDLAAVILEPICYNAGCIIPRADYIKAVRELTEENGILLIFDEVLSGFRMCPGGGQEYLGITPDLCTLGKTMGNGGAPLSAFAGKREIMEHVTPIGKVIHSGTFNAHPLSIAAGLASLGEISQPGFYDRLNSLGEKLYKGFAEVFEDLRLKARVQGLGARFGIYFGINQEVTDYRTAIKSDGEMFAKFQRSMMEKGVFFIPSLGKPSHHGFSSAHTKEDISKVIQRSEEVLREMRK